MSRGPRASSVAAAWLAALVAAAVIWPLAVLIWRGTGGGGSGGGGGSEPAADAIGVEWALLARSLFVAILIGVLATGLAIPAAWLARTASLRWVVALLAPMVLPNYLAYAGWSELRVGDTKLAWWLMTGPPDAPNTRPIVAGWVCAVGGLALWAWPIAAIVVATRVRRIDEAVLESLRLEPMSRARRALTLLGMTRSSIAAAVLVVTLVMLGSAVPLHVAQLDTYAIALWRQLDLTPPDQQWRVWLAGWPLAAIATIAGLWISRRTLGRDDPDAEAHPRPPPRRPHAPALALPITAWVIWLFSVMAPVVLLALNIRDPWFLANVWRTRGEAVTASAGIAAGDALVGALVAAAVWAGLAGSARASLVTRMAAGVLVITGLVPGVLLGVSAAMAWNDLAFDAPAAGVAGIVLVHAARLGLVGVLIGAWAFRSQPADERRLIALDGADTLRGWFRASLLGQPGPIVAAGLAIGLLSFHEIEAAVMLQPPGLDSFARQMLQLLHYARYEDLSESVVALTGMGVLLGTAIVAFAGWGDARRTSPVRTEG